jgi:hypothetical protein
MARTIDAAEEKYFEERGIRWEAVGSGYMKWFKNVTVNGKSYKVHFNIHPTTTRVLVTEEKYSEYQKKVVSFTRPVTAKYWDDFHIRFDEIGASVVRPIYFWYTTTGVFRPTPAQERMAEKRRIPPYLRELKIQADKYAKAFVAKLPVQG